MKQKIRPAEERIRTLKYLSEEITIFPIHIGKIT